MPHISGGKHGDETNFCVAEKHDAMRIDQEYFWTKGNEVTGESLCGRSWRGIVGAIRFWLRWARQVTRAALDIYAPPWSTRGWVVAVVTFRFGGRSLTKRRTNASVPSDRYWRPFSSLAASFDWCRLLRMIFRAAWFLIQTNTHWRSERLRDRGNLNIEFRNDLTSAIRFTNNFYKFNNLIIIFNNNFYNEMTALIIFLLIFNLSSRW